RSWLPPRDLSIRRPRSANISPRRDVRAPASLSHQVPRASSNHEQDRPLSLPARLGLYAMLAGLVLASFTVTGERRAPQSVTPTDDGATEARIRPLSRGVIRGLRDFDDPDPTPSPAPADTAAVVASGRPAPPAGTARTRERSGTTTSTRSIANS